MTMLKRLKDAGQLCRCEENRSRNTVRVIAEGHPRTVITLPISSTLKLNETP